MSDPIIMQELIRTEIQWVNDSPEASGLSITQANDDTCLTQAIWIPSGHVDTFLASILRACDQRL